MLVLSRRHHESIQIGDDIVITVLVAHGGNVKLGIEAPRKTRVLRSELIPGRHATSRSHLAADRNAAEVKK